MLLSSTSSFLSISTTKQTYRLSNFPTIAVSKQGSKSNTYIMSRIKFSYRAPSPKTYAKSATTKSILWGAELASKEGPPTKFSIGDVASSHRSSSRQKSASCFRYYSHSTSNWGTAPLTTHSTAHGREGEKSQNMSNDTPRRSRVRRKSPTSCITCRKRHVKVMHG